jgi:hypothetical protein
MLRGIRCYPSRNFFHSGAIHLFFVVQFDTNLEEERDNAMIDTAPIKYTFSGHDSFQCRHLWLKKGYDFAAEGKSFNEASAVVDLGVGKNMVSSIRFWLRAFGIISTSDAPTEFGNKLLADGGWDPYLEDDASLWLLHYQLLKTRLASTYYIVFNEFRRERIEFTRRHYIDFIRRKSEGERGINFNERTTGDDFEVLRKMYLADSESASIEESYAGLLSDLGLIGVYKRETGADEKKAKSRERTDAYFIDNTERPTLPVAVFMYAVLERYPESSSISLNNLSTDVDGPGAVFALSKTAIWDKVHEAASTYDFVSIQDYAGVQELQLKRHENPLTLLADYYGEGV